MNDAIETPASDGAIRIPELSVLAFAGPDASTFLQGYFTRDTTLLVDGIWLPNALCNLKGRVVANGWVQQDADTIRWVVHASVAAATAKLLEPYLRFSKTEVSLSAETVSANPEATQFSFASSADAADSSPWWALRTRQGEFVVSEQTADRYLPQMVGLASTAVDFDKGCYLGQEVVARAQHRGQVKRTLGLIETGATVGDELLDDEGNQVGEVVQSSPSCALVVVRSGTTSALLDGNALPVTVFD